MLAGTELEADDDREALAVHFAQRYAESRGKPGPLLAQQVRAVFGERGAEELIACVAGINFANLTGNTLDRVLGLLRRRGR